MTSAPTPLRLASRLTDHLEMLTQLRDLQEVSALGRVMRQEHVRAALVSAQQITLWGGETPSTLPPMQGLFTQLAAFKKHEADEYAVTIKELAHLHQERAALIEQDPAFSTLLGTLKDVGAALNTPPPVEARRSGRRTTEEPAAPESPALGDGHVIPD